ncbi:MAG: dipeptide ABC transporter ATP-binding protein [Clostridiales bacterium]|nr:dipeptide ABC transporter ATP-binding protein [Clostridiales bacterium]
MAKELIRVEHLKKDFPIKKNTFRAKAHVKAVDDISFSVGEKETIGLVGESGCGKSTTGRLMLNLLSPTSGRVLFEGKDIYALPSADMRRLRREMQIIFQDPYASLNPRMRVNAIVGEPLLCHEPGLSRGARDERVNELLAKVGLDARYADRYPHEFSGGQRQRLGIARAIALNPKLIICDEAVSALDVSVQSQVLNLFQDLQQEFNLTYVFIAHNLSVVKHISDRICVMYLGKIVELCKKNEIFESPLHPYTRALLSAIPIPDPEAARNRILLEGDIPSAVNPPEGCRFQTRCPIKEKICEELEPEFADRGGGHFVACHKV